MDVSVGSPADLAPARALPPAALRSGAGRRRDPLRRRMLALADALALLVGSVSLGFAFEWDPQRAAWAAIIAPLWLVFAKVYGLYDRDHAALRHLTVDELPSTFFWALTAAAGTALLLHATPAGGPSVAEVMRFLIAVGIAAFVFRSLARFTWRHLTAPERSVVLGDGPIADAARRKLSLFADIHARAVDGLPSSPRTRRTSSSSPGWLRSADSTGSSSVSYRPCRASSARPRG